MIVAGERRYRACQLEELVTVPVRIMELNEAEAYLLSIAENVNREDMTILEEAGAYADLAALGWSGKKIAGQFGKTESHVKWRLSLLALRDEVAKWVDEGKIKPNLAWYIAQLTPANQIIAANRYLRGDFDSEQEAVNFSQGLKMFEGQSSLVAEEAPTVEEKEKREKAKKQTTDKLSRVEETLMPLLDELTKVAKPEELADILGAEIGRYVRVVDRLTSQIQMARRMLRQAQGIAQGREVAWSEAVKAVQPEAGVAPTAEPAAEPVEEPKPKPARPAAKKTAPAKPSTPVEGETSPESKPARRTHARAEAAPSA
jgi:ParB family chromosome partitioning protein